MPLGQNATVADIVAKLDGFYANVSSSETLIQSFYSDYQKKAESVVSFASRIEQTLSRAVKSGHIDGISKDAMLRSKFWTGLKSQSLKNSTRHLYDTIKDFPSLLREIRKVVQEENSFKQTKKSTAQQQQCNQVTSDSNSGFDPTFMPCSGSFLRATEQRAGYQISWVNLQREAELSVNL